MKLRKKSILILIAAMAIMMLTSGCGQVKIGYIDGERVTKEAPQISALVEEGNQKIMEAQQQASQDVQKKLQEKMEEKKWRQLTRNTLEIFVLSHI